MKPRPRDKMLDPFFATMMFEIEKMIFVADEYAQTQGITLRDSQIQSALVKVIALCSAKTPKIEDASEADRLLKSLISELRNPPDFLEEVIIEADGSKARKPIANIDWAIAMDAVLDSLKTRKMDVPGSRTYLDFLAVFIAQALKKKS